MRGENGRRFFLDGLSVPIAVYGRRGEGEEEGENDRKGGRRRKERKRGREGVGSS